jgi:hypothetical protein
MISLLKENIKLLLHGELCRVKVWFADEYRKYRSFFNGDLKSRTQNVSSRTAFAKEVGK